MNSQLNCIFQISNKNWNEVPHECCFLCSKSLFFRLDQPMHIAVIACRFLWEPELFNGRIIFLLVKATNSHDLEHERNLGEIFCLQHFWLHDFLLKWQKLNEHCVLCCPCKHTQFFIKDSFWLVSPCFLFKLLWTVFFVLFKILNATKVSL